MKLTALALVVACCLCVPTFPMQAEGEEKKGQSEDIINPLPCIKATAEVVKEKEEDGSRAKTIQVILRVRSECEESYVVVWSFTAWPRAYIHHGLSLEEIKKKEWRRGWKTYTLGGVGDVPALIPHGKEEYVLLRKGDEVSRTFLGTLEYLKTYQCGEEKDLGGTPVVTLKPCPGEQFNFNLSGGCYQVCPGAYSIRFGYHFSREPTENEKKFGLFPAPPLPDFDFPEVLIQIE